MFPFFYSLAVLCLVLGSWPIGQFANALPEGQLAVRDSSYSSFTWGAIGDSWAVSLTVFLLLYTSSTLTFLDP